MTSNAPLSFTLTNSEGQPGIHILDMPGQSNELTLTLSNHTGKKIDLKGGAVTKQSALSPDGPAAFYLYFNRLLTQSELEGIQVDSSGLDGKPLPEAQTQWTAQIFVGKYGPYLALTPRTDTHFDDGNSLAFTISNINATPQAQTSYVSIDYRNIGQLPDATMQAKLFVFKLPSGKLLDQTNQLIQQASQESEQKLDQAKSDLSTTITAVSTTAQAAQTLARQAHDLAQQLSSQSSEIALDNHSIAKSIRIGRPSVR